MLIGKSRVTHQGCSDRSFRILILPSLWTRSYWVSTAGNVSQAVIQKYIQEQTDATHKHHSAKTSKRQEKILKELCLLSSCVYNITNYKVRHQFFAGEKVSGFYICDSRFRMNLIISVLVEAMGVLVSKSMQNKLSTIQADKEQDAERGWSAQIFKNRKTNTHCQLPCNGQLPVFDWQEAGHTAIVETIRKEYSIKQFKIDYNGVLDGKANSRGVRFISRMQFSISISLWKSQSQSRSNRGYCRIDLGIKRLFAIRPAQARTS